MDILAIYGGGHLLATAGTAVVSELVQAYLKYEGAAERWISAVKAGAYVIGGVIFYDLFTDALQRMAIMLNVF